MGWTRGNAAQRRYQRRVFAAMAVYVAALVGAGDAFRSWRPSGVGAAGLAILPALPVLAVFAAMALYLIEEKDEYLRFVTVRAWLVATGLTFGLLVVWGFLESFHQVARAPAFWAVVVWFACLAPTGLFPRGRA